MLRATRARTIKDESVIIVRHNINNDNDNTNNNDNDNDNDNEKFNKVKVSVSTHNTSLLNLHVPGCLTVLSSSSGEEELLLWFST